MNFFLNRILLLSLCILPLATKAQMSGESLLKLEVQLDSVIESGMAANEIPGLAIIIVQNDNVLLKKGYGYSSIEGNKRLVDPDSTIFRIGSVTKTFTATALLQLVDRGKMNLHEDVNTYLNSIQVPSTYNKPVTSAHLLNHSAGFDELRGRLVFNENQLIPLDKFLENRLIRLREPGFFTSYSSFGIALAGLLVEDVSGITLEDFMKRNIWEPLGMSLTSINLPKEHQRFLSPGYELRNGTNESQPWEWYHTFPASSINSTVSDMGKYMMMHLNLGSYKGTSILKENTAKSMQTQQLSVHSDVPGFAYGFYEEYPNDPKTINHGGDMLGYSSYLSLIPEKNLGVFVVSHHEGSRMRYQVIQTIVNFLRGAELENDISEMNNADLSRFAGSYNWSTNCHSCSDTNSGYVTDLVFNKDDNSLSGFGRTFYQAKPLLLRSYDGLIIMGFMEDDLGNIKYMSIGNSNTFERISE